MKILDIDLDYFITSVATDICETTQLRLLNAEYAEFVWNEDEVRSFLENNLGLSKENRVKGRIVGGHNESLFFWKELLTTNQLTAPFEVVHIDSHADLGLGYSSVDYILNELLSYPVEERLIHNQYTTRNGRVTNEGIGDYLLWAIAYRWISKITYCGNAYGAKNDYPWYIIKNFDENLIWNTPVLNTIQLAYNANTLEHPQYDDTEECKRLYLSQCVKEPEVPLLIIPTVGDVRFDGEFDYAVMAQSPNYTPPYADYILDIFREYIDEI